MQVRTPWETTTAQPSGELTWTASTIAERALVDGQWRPVDTTLGVDTTGVSPLAAVLPMTFSGGGDDAPLARVEHRGRSLELYWPLGKLPKPSVSGPAITYPGVLPDVDLVVTVDEDGTGFSEVLVVHTREAAQHPKLAELSFPIRVDGGVSMIEADGGLSVVDGSGAEVFASPTPLMWDSSGKVASPSLALADISRAGAGGAGSRVGNQDDESDSVKSGVEPRTVAPAQGDRVSAMPADLAGGELTINPDQRLLDSPETVWPVYIDPTFDAGKGVSKIEWAMIAEAWPNDSKEGTYYKFADSGGVGLCDIAVDRDCLKTGRKRLAWEFTIPAAIRGSQVSSATFRANKTSSFDCDSTAYNRLYVVNGLTPSTNWTNHHARWDGDAWIDSNKPTRCSGPEEWDATEGAQDASDNGWTTLSLGVRAANEGDMRMAWREFRKDATLSITFNRRPDTASAPVLDPSVTVGTGSSNWVRDSTPRLSASVSDPDGAEGQAVQAVIQVLNGSTVVWQGESALVASGSSVTLQVQTALLEGVLYTARAKGKDANGLMSKSWSKKTQFRLDLTRPDAAPTVTAQQDGDGVEAVYLEDTFAGGVGLTGKFSFGPDGVTDVDRYQYSFNFSDFTHEVSANESGIASELVSYTPDRGGLHTLRVRSVDRAGWVSETRVYRIIVNGR